MKRHLLVVCVAYGLGCGTILALAMSNFTKTTPQVVTARAESESVLTTAEVATAPYSTCSVAEVADATIQKENVTGLTILAAEGSDVGGFVGLFNQPNYLSCNVADGVSTLTSHPAPIESTIGFYGATSSVANVFFNPVGQSGEVRTFGSNASTVNVLNCNLVGFTGIAYDRDTCSICPMPSVDGTPLGLRVSQGLYNETTGPVFTVAGGNENMVLSICTTSFDQLMTSGNSGCDVMCSGADGVHLIAASNDSPVLYYSSDVSQGTGTFRRTFRVGPRREGHESWTNFPIPHLEVPPINLNFARRKVESVPSSTSKTNADADGSPADQKNPPAVLEE